MTLSAAAVDGSAATNPDWTALRLLLLDGEKGVAHALDAVRASERALQQDPLGDPAAIARWNDASMKHAMARQSLADALRAAVPAIVAFVRKFDDSQRRALAGPVRTYARELVGRQAPSDAPFVSFEERRARAYALRVAGAACFTGAEATAAWLARRDLHGWSFQLGPEQQNAAVLEVLRDRDPRWLAEVARRLASRVRAGNRQASGMLWTTAAALVRYTGTDPPTTDGFVYGWVLERMAPRPRTPGDGNRSTLLERLRDDPFLDALVPHLFEADEVGELLRWGTRSPNPLPAEQTWPGALAQLAKEGRLDRIALLDRCLGRLLRGGRAATQRAFLELHEELNPDLHELTQRTRNYQRLLPAAEPPVAELAQRVLRQLDEAGLLDRSVLLDASRAVLFRPERKLVQAQLAWLDTAARHRRDRPVELGELLGTLVVAFGQGAAQLHERTLSMLRRHARYASPNSRAGLLRAAEALPDDVRWRIAEALGSSAPATAQALATMGPEARQADEASGRTVPPASAVISPSPIPHAMPAPIDTPAELAEELAALFQAGAVDREVDETLEPVALERALAALVTLAHADRVALHKAIAPVLLRYNICPPVDTPQRASWDGWSAWLRSDDHWYCGARTAVGLIAAAAAMSPASVVTSVVVSRAAWLRVALSEPRARRHPHCSGPRLVMIRRLREIGTGLLYEPVPTLLATPATTAGHVDPAVLLDKLARAEREGWQPWELDLQQALLRLPRETDRAVLNGARRLRSPASQRLAERLERGSTTDPTLVRLVHTYPRTGRSWTPGEPGDAAGRTLVLAEKIASPPPARARRGRAARHPTPRGTPSLDDLLFALDSPARRGPERWWDIRSYRYAARLCWPALLPSHREMIAAHLLPALALLPRHSHSRGAGAVLPLLAEADGPVGIALTLAIAHGLGARERADRAAAADALVILAARGQLDTAALGRELAGLVVLGLFPVQRIIDPLRDVSMAGAHAEVWAIVATALPRLLPPTVERAPQRLAGLVALASETATLTGASDPIPAITAAGSGSSQLAAEARRLHQILAGGTIGRDQDVGT